MKLLSIKNPCPENWHAMNPVEQGAFCNSCQKNVIDFTQKTKTELITFFKENVGKSLCGRFGKHQLVQLNADYSEWEDQPVEIFRSKFILALVVVFGLSLFSCKGPEQIFQEPLSETEFSVSDTSQAISDLSAIEPEIMHENNSLDTFATEIFLSLKKTALFEPEILIIDRESGYPWIMGAIAIDPEWIFITDNVEQEHSLTLDFKAPYNELETLLDLPAFEIESFPAATSTGKETLVLTNYEAGYFSIIVRDSKSKSLIEIRDENLSPGKHEFELDLTPYCMSGLYFICISLGDTEKILPIQFENKTI